MKLPDIAKIAFEATRAFNQQAFGDFSQQPWDRLPEPTKADVESRVLFVVEHRGAPASSLHDRWLGDKLCDGWRKAEFTDAKQKLHVRLVPWTLLPKDEQTRDRLFVRIVEALLESL